MTGRVVAVNLAVVREHLGGKERTGIDKRPVSARVAVGPLGLEGDQILDEHNHGGIFKAVYAYAREDAAWWSAQLQRDIRPGSFGENLSTEGVALTDAVIGERWRIGTTLLQVTAPRIPCRVFAAFWDLPDLVARFTERGAPGAYLRVVAPGAIAGGDPVQVVERPAHGVTVGETFRALTTQPELLARLLDVPELPDSTKDRVRRRLGLADDADAIAA